MTEAASLVRPILRGSSESPIPAMLALASEPGMISFAGGHPDPQQLPRDWLVEAAQSVLTKLKRNDLQYGPAEGLPALRESVCELLSRRRIQAQPGEIMITTGSQQGMSLLVNAVLDPADAIAMAPFNYPAAMQAARFAGANIVTLDAAGEGLGELVRGAASRRIKVAYLVPSFANPTGHVMPVDARLRVLEDAQRHGILIIEDDPYGELWFESPPPDSLYALNQLRHIGASVAYLTSFSKTVLPALRLGVMCAPASIRRAVKLVKQAADVHSGLLEQHILNSMLRSGTLPEHLASIRAAYRQKAQAMTAALRAVARDSLSFREPAGGMFVWASLQELARPVARTDWFAFGRTHRVLIIPGQALSTDGRAAEHIRLSFANAGIEEIREGVKRLAAGLAAESARMAAPAPA